MCTYLKETNQTLNSWRRERDKDSWKLERREMMLYLSSKDGEFCFIGDSESSDDVYSIFRLSSDLEAL